MPCTRNLLGIVFLALSALVLPALVPPALVLSAVAAPQSGSRAAAQKLEWTSFEDPFERAFTLEVPRGWTVKGGLFRFGYSDQRFMVDLTSSDGKINVRLGDFTIPSYTVPSQYHSKEGEVYDLGAQARLIVARYRTGPEFAVLYSHVRFSQLCQNPTADDADVDFTMHDYLSVASSGDETSTGQIAYHCNTSLGPRIAFAYARTTRQAGIWQATTLASFLAPADQVSLAKSILLHCAQTFKVRPEWLEYQKKMDAEGLQYQRIRQQHRIDELNQQVQQFEAQMRAMQNQVNGFLRHQDAQAAQVQSFTNALRGVTPTLDPLSGETRDVWTGPKSGYWANGLGDVVNSTDAPSASYHKLQTTD